MSEEIDAIEIKLLILFLVRHKRILWVANGFSKKIYCLMDLLAGVKRDLSQRDTTNNKVMIIQLHSILSLWQQSYALFLMLQ